MISISPIAWSSGLVASLLFMILGWPLANALSAVRIFFDSFQMKLLLAAAIGAASAPVAEHHAPALQGVVDQLEDTTEKIPDFWDRLSERLP